MKTMKNIVAALMAVAMLLAMSVPAFAAAEDGTITISNADAGTTYSAYKLLELSYEDHGNDIPTDDGYVYYLPDNTDKADWYDFLTGTGIKDTYISIDGNEIVTWKDGADAKAFAEAALKYAEDNTLGPVSSGTAVGVTLTLNAAGPGYYLVDSSMGALVVLTTATPNVTIEEKNDAPTIEKKVLEVPEDGGIEDGTWEDLNRVEAGDEIYYRIIINAKPGAQNYVVHDKMDTDHLQLVSGSLRVYLNDDGSQNEGNKVDAANYTLTKADAGETLEDGCAFNIAFDNEFLADLGEDDVITLYYRAHFAVDEEAVKKAPHSNTVWLTYGDDKARNKTVVDVVETVSYGLEILKYANGNVSLTLGGAQFELYRTRTGEEGAYVYSDPVYFHDNGPSAEGKQVYTVCNRTHDGEEDPNITTIVTPEETGSIIIYGVDLETYYLKETQAPAGYNPLADAVEITLDVNHVTADRIFDVNVNNNSGSILPNTGGIGTTIFYAVGGLLVLGAVVLLITKKRMGAEK